MYGYLLPLHSVTRWLVVWVLSYAVLQAWYGWKYGRPFDRVDETTGLSTVVLVYFQILLGLWLYSISPVVALFLRTYPDSVHQREIRFFGMEHIVMMLTALVVITIGWAKTKRASGDREKFKTMFKWFLST